MTTSGAKKVGLIVGLLCLAVFLLTLFMYLFVTSRYGIGADFSIYWHAGKALFVDRLSPYSPQVSEHIQIALYGRPALPGEDQVRFAYPPFSLIAILPTVLLSFAWADAYWMAFNLIALFGAVIYAFPRAPRWVLLSLVFFFPIARSLILGQFALLLGTCLILVYGLIGRERPATWLQQILAGMLMAWCLRKPQLTLPFLLFFLATAFRKKYWFVFYGLAGAALVLGLISFWWLPDWVEQWHTLVTDYIGYVPIQPLYQVYAKALAPVLWNFWLEMSILATSGLATIFLMVKWQHDSNYDALALMSLAIIGQIISPNPKSMISDQILFLLPMLIWIAYRTSKFSWEKPVWWSFFVLAVWATFIIFFTGQESLQAEATLPLVGAAWLLWVYFVDMSLPSPHKKVT
jgi:hypothetical protein